MRKMALAAVTAGFVLATSAIQGQARIVNLAPPESSVTLGNPQLATDTSTLSFTATNSGAKAIRSYSVSVFYFPKARPTGFTNRLQRPDNPIATRQSHEGNIPLGNQVPLDG